MRKTSRPRRSPATLRKEYDFRGGVRGKYARRMNPGATLVVLDPDVATAFPDGEAVNRALRGLIKSR